MTLFLNFWALMLEAAPWLLFGFLVAGCIKVFVPAEKMNQHLGGDDFKTTVKAALIGAPLPLCSCGVIPAALGLRRSGASKSATVSFLVATPETGVDSVSISYVMLGPVLAIVRPIAAITSAICAGVLVGREQLTQDPAKQSSAHGHDSTDTCCEPETLIPEVPSQGGSSKSCCGASNDSAASSTLPLSSRQTLLKQCLDVWQFATGKLVADTAVWLIIGLMFAALVQTYVPVDWIAQWGSGLLAMMVMMVISVPMYICATASTPIAAGLLFAGVSPGAVLVFMLAGPATNIATLGVVLKELGQKALVAYLFGVLGVAMLFGAVLDLALLYWQVDILEHIEQHHEVLPLWLSQTLALFLCFLLIKSLYQQYLSKN